MCQNWFGMDMQITAGIDQSEVDIFLTTEKGLELVQDQLEKRMGNKHDKDAQDALADIPLLVICNSVSAANAMMHHPRSHVTGVLSQVSKLKVQIQRVGLADLSPSDGITVLSSICGLACCTKYYSHLFTRPC
jgi:hypothetical protein